MQEQPEAEHETQQPSNGEAEPLGGAVRQTVVEQPRTGDPKRGYFSQFKNWVSFITLLFVGAYTVMTFCALRNAQNAVSVSLDTEKRQLRAYVTSNGGGATLSIEPISKKIAMHGVVRLRNSGGTPAYNLTLKIAAKIAARDAVPFTEIGPISDEYGRSVMGPGTEYEIGTWTDYDPNDDGPQLEAGLKRTFVWGRVDYDDAFGTHRWFEFREVSANQIGIGKWTIAAHKMGESGN